MRRLLALVPVGIFGFAGYAISFRAIPPGSLAASADGMTRVIGPGLAGALVFSLGIVISWYMLRSAEKQR